MIDTTALMELHLEALFTLDGSGRLVSTNEPDGSPAPRFFLGRTPDGNVWRVRHDVSRSTVAELEAIAESEPIASTSALTDAVHEAGVETHPEYRGRGLAGPVVRGWAHHVRSEGRFPLYSTSWKNRPSQSVARKLGLIQYGTDFHLT